METPWYVPITVLPGVGVIILSTTSQMMALSGEIGELLASACGPFEHALAGKKITQLRRLTLASTLLYVSAALFVLAGIYSALVSYEAGGEWLLLGGVAMFFGALGLLTWYGFRAIAIREAQHRHKLRQYQEPS